MMSQFRNRKSLEFFAGYSEPCHLASCVRCSNAQKYQATVSMESDLVIPLVISWLLSQNADRPWLVTTAKQTYSRWTSKMHSKESGKNFYC